MKKFQLLAFTLLFLSNWTFGQQLYNTEHTFKIKGFNAGSVCYFAYSIGEKQYVRDTMLVQDDGTLQTKSDTLNAGEYLLYFEDGTIVNLVINEPKFVMTADKADLVGTARFTNSPENTTFYAYLNFLSEQRKVANAINNSEDSEDVKTSKLEKLDTEVKKFQQNQIKTKPNLLSTKFMKASMEVDIPQAPEGLSEKEKNEFEFYYYRKHYFDNMDLSVSAFKYSSLYSSKIMNYIEKLTVQSPDSLIVAVDKLVGQAKKNKELYEYTVITLVNYFAKSKQICFDAVYVHIVDQYYQNASWIETSTLQRMQENADALRGTLCGKTAPNFTMTELNADPNNLHEVAKKKWTILVFYNGDSQNAVKELQELHKIESQFNREYQIVTVSHKTIAMRLNQVFGDLGASNWINFFDPLGETDVFKTYNVKTDFSIFVLEDLNIYYKQISVEDLSQFFLD